ncbi:MAG: excisionase [Deltaproteobacteria bacterium]|jgi:hypothetical protein|nr:excisionase [Deltaproteobacteria bacterium]
MNYELMHKELAVAVLAISLKRDQTFVDDITEVFAHPHMPIGTTQPNSLKCKPEKLEDWLKERAIPKERSGLKRILEECGLPYPNQLLFDSLGLSLSDQYWLRPCGSGLAWKDVNFFHNEFSNDLGEILLGNSRNARDQTFVSPDASSSGFLPKRWIISEGRRLLMKGGKAPGFQEPENEVIASYAMESLGIPHVDYDLSVVNGKPYSLCETFVDGNTDFISAYYIADRLSNMPDDESKKFDFFLGWCDKRGIVGAREAMDRIIVTDFFLLNTDRHFNNFGVLRDADTLEWKGFSPVFDTGNCLCNEVFTEDITPILIGECKPFRKDFRKQLLHVGDFSWVDLGTLKAIPDKIADFFTVNGRLSRDRVERIRQGLCWRVEFLENVILRPESLSDKPRKRHGPGLRP